MNCICGNHQEDYCPACGGLHQGGCCRTSIEDAAQELAAAKKAYSESFLRHRIRAKTDTQAEHMATVECGEELTLAQARYELALRQS